MKYAHMRSIAEITAELVKKNPFIHEGLRDGLINLSAYARQIIPIIEKEYGDEVKLTTVVMAIQRMDYGNITYETKKLKSLFKKIKDIQVRGHLICYTLRLSNTLQKNVAKIFDKFSTRRNDVMVTFTQGVFESTLIISGSEAKNIEKMLEGEEILHTHRNISAFVILLPPENTSLSGVYYAILKQLAWEGINIVDVISTANEFTILVNDKDSGKCFEALRNL
jgi:aspartokinase